MSARGRNKNLRWSGITLRGMATAIGLCLILLTVVIAVSAKGSFGPSANDNRTDASGLESQVSVESPDGDSGPSHSDLVSDDSSVVGTFVGAVTADTSSNESIPPSSIGKTGFKQGHPHVSPSEGTPSSAPDAPALLLADIDGIQVFADPDSDRLYLRGTIRSHVLGLTDNQQRLNVNPGLDAGMPAWDLIVVATGRAAGSDGSDSWSTALSAGLGEVEPGTSQEFALRSPRLQIGPQDFVDFELIVSVNGSTVTRATAHAIAWESQDRPPMPYGFYWWERQDDSDYAELS
jgi:hypothetical protein